MNASEIETEIARLQAQLRMTRDAAPGQERLEMIRELKAHFGCARRGEGQPAVHTRGVSRAIWRHDGWAEKARLLYGLWRQESNRLSWQNMGGELAEMISNPSPRR